MSGNRNDKPRLPAGIPGWKRADCLGCGERVVEARDGYVCIGGTADGSYLVKWGDDPVAARTTNVEGPPKQPLHLLGVAHTACADDALVNIRKGGIAIGADTPVLKVDQGEHLPDLPYTLHLPADGTSCPFCDTKSGLSREHVWPDWYSKFLRTEGAVLAGPASRAGKIEVTVRVCDGCNNTWMSVLENDTRPTLTHMMQAAVAKVPSITLDARLQAQLSAWAVKTAYLLDVHSGAIVPRGFLREFKLRRTPNESTVVWVAGYTPGAAAKMEKRAMNFPGTRGPTTNSPNGIVVTFTILNVLFQVAAHFNGGPAHMTDGSGGYRAGLFRIWPTSDHQEWPPSVGYSEGSWDGLVASIRG